MLLLSYADGTDDSGANLRLVMIGLLVIAVAATVAALPILNARRRSHPHLELIGAAMLIWAIAVSWSGISLVAARGDWEKEKNLRLESGYDSSASDAGLPQPPVAFWSALACGWVLVCSWALLVPVPLAKSAAPGGMLKPADGSLIQGETPPPRDPLSS